MVANLVKQMDILDCSVCMLRFELGDVIKMVSEKAREERSSQRQVSFVR